MTSCRRKSKSRLSRKINNCDEAVKGEKIKKKESNNNKLQVKIALYSSRGTA